MIGKVALLLFAGEVFSLPIDRIQHILQEPDVFPLVNLRKGFSGVFLFEDDVVPMLLADDHGARPAVQEQGPARYTVVYQSDFGTIGLPVESVDMIVDADNGEFTEVPPDDTMSLSSQAFLFRGKNYPVLDIDTMLAQLPC